MRQWLTTQEVRNAADETDWQEWYKYVRVSPAEFRFVHIARSIEHCALVTEGEKPVSAGGIKINQKGFAFMDYGSHSLNLDWDATDEALLQKALGRACVGEYDL